MQQFSMIKIFNKLGIEKMCLYKPRLWETYQNHKNNKLFFSKIRNDTNEAVDLARQ